MKSSTIMRQIVGAAVLLAACTACSQIGLRPPRTVSEGVIGQQVIPVRTESVVGEVQQKEKVVYVFASRQCSVRDQEILEIQTVTARDHYIQENRDVRLYLLLGGIASAALGTYLLLDAETVSESSRRKAEEDHEDEYTSVSAVQAAGGSFIGLGALAGVLAIADTIRVSGAERTIETGSRPGDFIGAPRPCGEAPYAGANVSAITDDATYSLGTTDATGAFKITTAELAERLGNRRARIVAEGQPVGSWPF